MAGHKQHRATEQKALGPELADRLERLRRQLHLRLTDAAQRYWQRRSAAETAYEKDRAAAYESFRAVERAIHEQAGAKP